MPAIINPSRRLGRYWAIAVAAKTLGGNPGDGLLPLLRIQPQDPGLQ